MVEDSWLTALQKTLLIKVWCSECTSSGRQLVDSSAENTANESVV